MAVKIYSTLNENKFCIMMTSRKSGKEKMMRLFLLLMMFLSVITSETEGGMKKVNYGGWPNCISLSNKEVELIVTTDVGPRVISYGFIKGENILKEFKDQLGKTGDDEWIPYGGHRLWYAPEDEVKTYRIDNSAVENSWNGKTLKLTQQVDVDGIQKEIEITLDKKGSHVTLVHRLINRGKKEVEAALWCLTILRENGRVIIPHEPYRPHPDYLLPARPLILWHYTDMTDKRYSWGKKYIQFRQDPGAGTKQKIGVLNKLGWGACSLGDNLFIKKFDYDPDATYADYGCNMEVYTDPGIIEFETLGPLVKIAPGKSAEHVEHWYLYKMKLAEDEDSIDKNLLPLLK